VNPKISFFSTIILELTLMPASLFAQGDADREGVKMAVLDYVEGLYLVQPERIERSVSKNLAKIGYWREEDQNTICQRGIANPRFVQARGELL